MKKNLKMCIEVSSTPLKKLNESENGISTDRYIFSGIFTACSVPGHVIINRNNRSYPEREMLSHLSYLRESIKNNGCLIGELDHPEGRFDIQLKQASHKITDLWYDQDAHCVMGKLELLDTPNGKIAKELVEANYPLFVSSRAAGDVDEKTHEVSIAQIFTYDIVCTPGFEEARLDRVNESVLSDVTKNFLNESASVKKAKKTANEKLGVTAKNVEVYEINEEVDINEKVSKMMSKPINMKDLCTPLLEEEEPKDEGEKFELPEAEVDPKEVNDSEGDKTNDEKEEDKKNVDKDESPENTEEIDAEKNDLHEDTDEEKEKKRSLILSIKGEDEEGDPINGDIDATDDSEKEENREKILDIQAEEATEEDTTEEEAEKSEKDKSNEDEEKEEEIKKEDVKEATLKKNRIAIEAEKGIEELEDVLDSVIKTESVKESIVRRYPFAISLSDKNFAKFAALRPNQKKKCADFILEHEIFNVKAINELWSTPLKEEKRVQQNWLKLASQADIDLYVKAPIEVQDAIEESAKYVILETQEDVDEFWRKTGLRQAEARRRMNEEFVSYYKNNMKNPQEAAQQNPLGYNMDFIRMTEDWFNNND